MLGPRAALLLAVLLGEQSRVLAADGDGVQLVWHAPNECPDQADVESRIPELVPGHGARGRAPRAVGRITLTREGAYRLDLQTEFGQRSLLAADCDELASATALVLALLRDRAGPEEPAPAPPRNAWLLLRLELAADLGTLPYVGIGPGLSVGLHLHDTSVELSGTYFPSQSVRVPQRMTAVAEVRLLSAALGVCQAITAPLELSPCVSFELGQLLGTTPDSARSGQSIWVMGLAGVRLSGELGLGFRGVVELELGLPVRGASFSVEPLGNVHQTGDVVGRLRAGLELRL